MVSEHKQGGMGLPNMSKDDMAKMNQVKQVTSALGGEIVVDFKESTVTVRFISDDPKLAPVKENLLDQLPQQLAMQLDMFFGIKGKIIKRNRNAEKPKP